jgi:hypothetical protein
VRIGFLQQDSRITGYLVGLQKLINLWKANQQIPTKRLFAETWQLINRNETLFASPFISNRFNVSWRNYVFVDVARNFKLERPDFAPELKLQLSSVEHDAYNSSIFVTLHSEIEYSIVSALQRIGSKCIIISASKANTLPTIYEHMSGMGRIVRDQNCLLLARKELIAGHTIIAPVDYTLYDKETKGFIHKIGMGVFDFAKKCRFPVFYILPIVGPEGGIDLFVKASGSTASSGDCADDFLEFCASCSPNKIKFIKDNWYSDTRGKWDANLTDNTN